MNLLRWERAACGGALGGKGAILRWEGRTGAGYATRETVFPAKVGNQSVVQTLALARLVADKMPRYRANARV